MLLRRTVLVVLALLIAVGAVALTRSLLGGFHAHGGRPSEAAVGAPPSVQVLVANADLPAGAVIKADDLVWRSWPGAEVPPDYAVQGRARLQDYVGAVATGRMSPGDPVTPARLVRPGERGYLAAILAPGDRAMTVNVTPNTGMAGFLYPGDRVDLILSYTASAAPGSASRHVSETLLRRLKVVGLDQTLSDRKDPKGLGVPKTVTLEVTPKQAEIVAVAADLGVLTLALDSVADPAGAAPPATVTKTWDTEATQIALSGAPAPSSPARKVSARGVWTVDVVRGGTATPAPFALTGGAANEARS